MTETFPIIAKTLAGFETILQQELHQEGIVAEPLHRAVGFQATLEQLYRVNYTSRLALRFLREIASFQVVSQDEFYEGIRQIAWEDFLSVSQTFVIDAVISGPVFSNSLFMARKAKDGIVDRFRERTGKRPSVDLEHPHLRIHLHLAGSRCTVFLDSSGESLHKRGYRKRTWEAPLGEVLAAGLIRLAGWDLQKPLYDPMCGSGTIPMEAVMLAGNVPAGFFRKDFGFMKWNDFSIDTWKMVKEGADAQIRKVEVPVRGTDKARQAIHAAKINIRHTPLGGDVQLAVSNFHSTKPPFSVGMILTNPPYDERIRLDDGIAFYRSMGDTLKHLYKDWEAWIISSDLRALKFVGLKPAKKYELFNGPLACRLVGFPLY